MAAVALAFLLGACASPSASTGTATASLGATVPLASTAATAVGSVSEPSPAVSATPATSGLFPGLVACQDQPRPGDRPWLCGTVTVPLDRADAAAGSLSIAYYVLPHGDRATPAGTPFFASPGGPGERGYNNYVLYAMQPAIHAHHDMVTFDPRGTGHSGAIDCPDLQRGPTSEAAAVAAAAACGQQLDAASGRYGGADRAADLEAVRDALGFQKIDYYGGSYGGVDVQAYAARYGSHLHAIVLDSAFPMTDAAHLYWTGGSIGAAALIHVPALQCRRDDACSQISKDPEAAIWSMVERVRDQPVIGPPTVGSDLSPITVDEVAAASILTGATPLGIVTAAMALARNDPQPLIDLSAQFRPFAAPGTPDPVTEFSDGANLAGPCNDQDLAWDRSDPVATRQSKYAAYLASLPSDTFAPFSKQAWSAIYIMDFCIKWPAPVHFTPVIPAGTTMPDVPALILSGDEDNNIPPDISRTLLDEFPKAAFVVIAGARHPTMSMDGDCPSTIAAAFLETLKRPDISCAGTPG